MAVVTVRQKGSRQLTALGLRWGIAAAIVISFLAAIEKILIRDIGYMQYAPLVMITSALVMWAMLMFRQQRLELRSFATSEFSWLMVLRAVSAYGIQLALVVGTAVSLSVYISSLSVILIVLLGIVLLGERDYLKQKLVATGLATLGLTVILLAH